MFLWCLSCIAEGSSALDDLKTECPAPASRLSLQRVSLLSLLASLTQPEPIHSTVPPDAPKDICLGEILSERPAGNVLPPLITSLLLSMVFPQWQKAFCKTCRSGWKMRAPVGHTRESLNLEPLLALYSDFLPVQPLQTLVAWLGRWKIPKGLRMTKEHVQSSSCQGKTNVQS